MIYYFISFHALSTIMERLYVLIVKYLRSDHKFGLPLLWEGLKTRLHYWNKSIPIIST